MAGEIPPLAADRLAAPDWPAPAASDRFSLPAARVLGLLEDAGLADSLPESILDGLRRAAAAGDPAGVLLAADRGIVVLLVEGRRATLAGATRDAVLALLGEEPELAPAGAPLLPGVDNHGAPDAAAAARAADIDAQIQQARGQGGAADELESAPAPALPLVELRAALPLLADASLGPAAGRLADAIDGSGMFLEAHVAQWLRGERSLAQVLGETERLARPEGTPGPPDQRAAAQLEAMQRQAFALLGQAWDGQAMRLEIERERERHREAANSGDATGMFVATLTLDLPHLGALRARIRIVDHTVGIHLESDRASAIVDELAQLHDALSARGLQVAQLDAAPVAEGPA